MTFYYFLISEMLKLNEHFLLKLRTKLDLFLVGIFQFLSTLNHLLFPFILMKEYHVISEKQIPVVACPTSDIRCTNRFTSKFYVFYPKAINSGISHRFTSNPKFRGESRRRLNYSVYATLSK